MTLLEGKHNGEFIVSEAPGARSRDVVTVAAGNKLGACAVIGLIALGAAAAAAVAGNTGNGTSSAVAVGAGAVPGVYRLIALGATKFSVEDPNGHEVGVATTGAAFTGGGITLTLTAGGTAFVPGDGFTVTVAAGSGKAVAVNPAGADGSAVAAGVLIRNTDATAADKKAAAILRDAEVRTSDLDFGTLNGGQVAAAKAQLALLGIVCRDAV